MASERIILGIDPGTNISGYCILKVVGAEMHLQSMGIFDLRKEENQSMKLNAIYQHMSDLIAHYLPDELAIEAPFFGKNAQSMLKLGRAQGVSMAAALQRNIPVFEYAPKRIKQAVTGNGNASKEQVAAMVKSLLRFQNMPNYYDATDAAAIAICHFFTSGKGTPSPSKNYTGWKAFLSDNPDKLK